MREKNKGRQRERQRKRDIEIKHEIKGDSEREEKESDILEEEKIRLAKSVLVQMKVFVLKVVLPRILSRRLLHETKKRQRNKKTDTSTARFSCGRKCIQ